jgi:aquaporin Z
MVHRLSCGSSAPAQLWLFWVAPIIGAVIAGATYAMVTGVHREDRDVADDVPGT